MIETFFTSTELPEWFHRATLIRTGRSLLSEHPPSSQRWEEPPEVHTDPHERLLSSILSADHLPPEASEYRELLLEHRHELLRLLTCDHQRLEQRDKAAREYIAEHLEFYSGWAELVSARSPTYQLDQARPWWRGGDPLLEAQNVKGRAHQVRVLEEEGYERVAREVYIERIRHTVISQLLAARSHKPTELEFAAKLIILFASKQRLWKRSTLTTLAENHLTVILAECAKTLTTQGARIPMKPLYSLPREAQNIGNFWVLPRDPERARVDEQGKIVRVDENARAIAKLTREGIPPKQQLLFADRELVNKRSGEPDSFIGVELDADHPDTLGALIKAIEKFDVDPNVFEHLPRVCAGMFAASHRDRRLGFDWPGTFWDTESGYRLCRIIGFNPGNHRHRKRVQDARALLENFVLHREVKGRDEHGRKTTIRWKGPIIEAKKSQIELEIEDREGLSEHHVYQSWSIAKPLWEMTLPEDQGGTPSFMLLDERAFELDDRSSLPFNLYWTLVNRAYMASYTRLDEHRVQDDGSFFPKLWTLYDWSGMEQNQLRISRLKDRFRDALNLMVENNLLIEWSCAELDPDHSTSVEDLKDARVRVRFPEEQLENLPALPALA
jgi:hypothetical protein